jgi:hypothetical protein
MAPAAPLRARRLPLPPPPPPLPLLPLLAPLLLLLLQPRLLSAQSACPNACSMKGECLSDGSCACLPGFAGFDCAQRECPAAAPWVRRQSRLGDSPAFSPRDAPPAVCSNAGVCDPVLGVCTCFTGYGGAACERSVCMPFGGGGGGNCTGAGRCLSMRELHKLNAGFGNVPRDDGGTVAAAGAPPRLPPPPGPPTGADVYSQWDADKVFGCACNRGFDGPDCSLARCPEGDNPHTRFQQRPAVRVLVSLPPDLAEAAAAGRTPLRLRFWFAGQQSGAIELASLSSANCLARFLGGISTLSAARSACRVASGVAGAPSSVATSAASLGAGEVEVVLALGFTQGASQQTNLFSFGGAPPASLFGCYADPVTPSELRVSVLCRVSLVDVQGLAQVFPSAVALAEAAAAGPPPQPVGHKVVLSPCIYSASTPAGLNAGQSYPLPSDSPSSSQTPSTTPQASASAAPGSSASPSPSRAAAPRPGSAPFVIPSQFFAYNTMNGGGLLELALQDGSGRCLGLDTCAGAGAGVGAAPLVPGQQGAQAIMLPCGGGGISACLVQTQAWSFPSSPLKNSLTAGDGTNPSALCLEAHGGADANAVDVWPCEVNDVHNFEWRFNATSGALINLADGLCLTATTLANDPPQPPAPLPLPIPQGVSYQVTVLDDDALPNRVVVSKIVAGSPQLVTTFAPIDMTTDELGARVDAGEPLFLRFSSAWGHTRDAMWLVASPADATPTDLAAAAVPEGASSATSVILAPSFREHVACAGAGLCNFADAVCACFAGSTGAACERLDSVVSSADTAAAKRNEPALTVEATPSDFSGTVLQVSSVRPLSY